MTRDDKTGGDGARPDLRYTSVERDGVRIERSLYGSGRLARGDHTNMHSIQFTARAAPRRQEKVAPEEVSTPSLPPVTASVAEPLAKPEEAPAVVEPTGFLKKFSSWLRPKA